MEEERERNTRKRGQADGAVESENEDELSSSMVTDGHQCKPENAAAMVDEAQDLPNLETSAPDGRAMPGAPIGWNPPGPPKDWKGPSKHSGINVPSFEDVDNPGNWSPHAFQPKCK